ncbi:hypothetical protein [Lysobacter gummosus]
MTLRSNPQTTTPRQAGASNAAKHRRLNHRRRHRRYYSVQPNEAY